MYIQDIQGCFKANIGNAGISQEDFSSELEKSSLIIKELKKQRDSGTLPLLSNFENTDELSKIKNIANKIKEKFTDIILLGMGGSTLCPQALTGLLSPYESRSNVKLHFMDNVDPHSINAMLSSLNLTKTGFLVISKSGGTMETLSQFSVCFQAISDVTTAKKASNHFYIITDLKDSPLRRIGKNYGIKILNHEAKIGGRFATFSNVGLLPAAVVGLDIRKICDGAKKTIEDTLFGEGKALKGAVLNTLLMKQGIGITIFMPYIDRLKGLTSLIRQIWAESLGKSGNGTTPIDALGTLDQHSQLQLYLDGPKDKMFTIFNLSEKSNPLPLPSPPLDDPSLSYLHNQTMWNIMNVSCNATTKTLTQHKLPVRTFTLTKLDEEVLGSLIMHFMLETIITANLLNINPFNQPAVEEGKILAKEYLS